jgi:hypothetical protein
MRLIYLVYGLLVVGLAGTADYRGLTFTRTEQMKVPKSIRDNPGAYRSLYRGTSRYTGGK